MKNEIQNNFQQIKKLFPFELVQGDSIKRTNPHSAVNLNSNATWLVSQEKKAAHKTKEFLSIFNDIPMILEYLVLENKILKDTFDVKNSVISELEKRLDKLENDKNLDQK